MDPVGTVRHVTTPADWPAVSAPTTGDVFAFRGLDGDVLDGRRMTICGISVSGRVQFEIGFLGESTRGLHDAPLTDVLAMIGAGIWVPDGGDSALPGH